MKKSFDLASLVSRVHEQTEESLSFEELKSLLEISEDAYSKDSPLSVGKRLVINSLEFEGAKGDEETEEPIHYLKRFDSGVYLWVGDNLVGKSSIFKIIKLAITGNKKISRDVEGWLTQIWVEFSIGSNSYTVHIQRPDLNRQKNFQFSLYKGHRQQPMSSHSLLFDGGNDKYKEYMESLFFRELSYYSLQWTQHSSKAENPGLLTSNASWSTYFKSVFLEAGDYGALFFGGQAELIFQMLLGLELTYPINRLRVKRKHLESEMGIVKSTPSFEAESNQSQRDADQKELARLIQDLTELHSKAEKAINSPAPDTEKVIEEARKRYLFALDRKIALETEKSTLEDQAIKRRGKIRGLTHQIEDYEIDITKKKRRASDVQEFLDLGAFFNSLEVRTCPNCNHSVDKGKVVQEKDTGNCRLCEHEVEPQPLDKEAYSRQISQLEEQRKILYAAQYKLRLQWEDLRKETELEEKRIGVIKGEFSSLRVEQLYEKLESLKENAGKTAPVPFDWIAHLESVTKLVGKKAVLEQKLESSVTKTQQVVPNLMPYEQKIAAITVAVDLLFQEREIKSASLITTFEQLYLKQLHAFGLPHYDRVEVLPNFKLAYHMHNDVFNYEDITPGEKLRAKLGLYIALIELDVEYQLGRHPRFLVLDSPAREEGDRSYVDGLKDTLAYIQEKFGDELQVFVGTAQRELASAVDSKRLEVKAENEFFF